MERESGRGIRRESEGNKTRAIERNRGSVGEKEGKGGWRVYERGGERTK